MKETRHVPTRMRWAPFRFGVISPLLTSPPDPGELAKALDELASQTYQHPGTESVLLGVESGRFAMSFQGSVLDGLGHSPASVTSSLLTVV